MPASPLRLNAALDPMRDPPALPPVRPGPVAPRTVLLVNPFYAKDVHASFGKHVLVPSLALTSLAGATPAPWKVSFWDENLLQGPPPLAPIPEVVGITVHLTFAKRAYELAAWFRAHGSVVVMGGLHALSCPDEVEAHADAIVIGNGVPSWPEVLRDIERGALRPRYRAEYVDYASDPLPDRSIVPEYGFLSRASIIATQGCHNRCDFCYLATGDTRIKYQTRTPAQVARELEATGEPYAVFVDNNLGSNRKYLRELCRELRPLRKIWSAAVTLDVTDDPSLVREMALAGCTGVFIGFESLTDANIRLAGKRSPRADDYAARVDVLHASGIQVNGSFVLGFDHDRKDAFELLVDWIERVRLECATFHILTPYPDTPLFRRMKSEGRLLHEDWSFYDTAHAVFRPKHMTPEELEAGYAWLYERLFSLASIWARRPHDAAAVPPYLAMALLYKRMNPTWQRLIQSRMTHAVWRPLVEATRLRHLRFRERLAREGEGGAARSQLPSFLRPSEGEGGVGGHVAPPPRRRTTMQPSREPNKSSSQTSQASREPSKEARATESKNMELMQTLDDAWNSQDWDTFEKRHKSDTVVRWPAQPPTHGIHDHRAEGVQMFKTFPDNRVHNRPYKVLFANGDWTCSIARFTGTMTGEMVLADGTKIPPTGKRFEVDFCTVARWHDGQIVEENLFYDVVGMMKQLGIG